MKIRKDIIAKSFIKSGIILVLSLLSTACNDYPQQANSSIKIDGSSTVCGGKSQFDVTIPELQRKQAQLRVESN
jgi:hypothetical protein